MGQNPPQKGDPLTAVQERALEGFRMLHNTLTKYPSLREMSALLEISPKAVDDCLKILVKKGYLEVGSSHMARRYHYPIKHKGIDKEMGC